PSSPCSVARRRRGGSRVANLRAPVAEERCGARPRPRVRRHGKTGAGAFLGALASPTEMRRLNAELAELTEKCNHEGTKTRKVRWLLRVFVLSWLPSTTSRTSLRPPRSLR